MAEERKLMMLLLIGILFLLAVISNLKLPTRRFLPKPKPGMQMEEGLRRKIYESKWIELFPHLKRMVRVVTDGNPLMITNARNTFIEIVNSNAIRVGGTLKATITTYNEAGEKKSIGGDFFAVILRRPGSKTDGVTCEVADQLNGSYSVSCILPWEGKAIVEATLIHPSETIYQLMKRYSSEEEFMIYQNTTVLNSKNKTEFTACSVGFPDKRLDEICDCSNPTHGEKRTCLRTPSGECPKEILYQKKTVEKSLRPNLLLYCNDRHYLVPINGSKLQINIQNSEREVLQSYFIGNLSKFIHDPMTPSGWLLDGKWTSVKTHRSFNIDQKSIENCFANKRLHFFGDSTARNIYFHFIRTLKITDFGLDNSIAWSRGRDAISEKLNMSVQYRSHGPPLNNPGPEDARPYMSDSFDAIKEGGNGTIVTFTIGYHFHFFDPDVYLRRLKIIKQAVTSLLRRLPGAKVIIKGLHYHGKTGCSDRSPWLTYKLITLLRHEFRGLNGVYFVELWDYTLLRNNADVHPPQDTLEGTIKILMSYVCS